MKMGKVIAKRFIFMIPVVLAVTFIIFMLSFISAGDAARVLAEKKYEVNGEKCIKFSELFL